MIHQAEISAMINMKDMMEQNLTQKRTYLHQITVTYADWNDTAAFVEGKNADFIRNNWVESSITREYGFNISLFANTDNRIVYSEFYDPVSGRTGRAPSGLQALVEELQAKITALHRPEETVQDRVKNYSGMVREELYFLGGEPYAVCAAPVADYKNEKKPSGIFVNALKFTGSSLMAMTYNQAREIRVYHGEHAAAMEPYKINMVNSKLISINIPLQDTEGNILMLETFQDRRNIRSGTRVIVLTSIFLFLATLSIFFLLSWLFNSMVVHPIYQLSAEVAAIKGNEALELKNIAGYDEIRSLGENINNMLQHLTDREEAEAKLMHRYQQQKLTLELTRLFASTRGTDEVINGAIAGVGSFLDVCRVLVARINQDQGLWEFPYVWQQDCVPKKSWAPLPLDPDMKLIAAFEKEGLPYLIIDDASAQSEYVFRPDPALKSFLSVPIYVNSNVNVIAGAAGGTETPGETLWGIISLDLCEYGNCLFSRKWSENDIQLIGLFKNELSIAITRRMVQHTLDRVSAVVEATPCPVMFLDFEGITEYVNPAFVHDFGYSLREIQAQGLGLVLEKEELDMLRYEVLPAVLQAPYSFVLHPKRKDGKPVVHQALAFTVTLDSGEQGIGFTSSDITEIIAAKELAEKAREQAEFYSNAKSGFISRMSHEMRTPMNAIVGMTGLARNTEDKAEQLEYLAKIDSSARDLTGIINNMLDMVKFEDGSFELASMEEFDLPALLEDLAAKVQLSTGQKGLAFHAEWEGVPQKIISDKYRITQVLFNLFSNAVKFTTAGSVEFSASVQPALAIPGGALCFEVRDTGPGIPKAQMERLWEAFEQGDNSITRQYGGVGLGLTVSKNIVEKMGGTIEAESELGKGSVFRCRIPVKLSQPGPSAEGSPPQKGGAARNGVFAGRRFLIVDDNDMNREILLAVLEETGAALDSAADGREAVEKWTLSGGGWDLFLMDLHMPVMDGFEAARRIRASALPRADRVPIIAVSADTGGEVLSRCLETGMNCHIGKPVDFEVLMENIRRFL
jgi:PAS domain S-box-containing protein